MHYARLVRQAGSDQIVVDVLLPDLTRTHYVDASSLDDRLSMAECLQEHLDGFRGGDRDVEPYRRALDLLKDA